MSPSKTSETHHRPRPGRSSLAVIGAILGVVAVAGFSLLLALGIESLAAAMLFALPLGEIVLRHTTAGRYLARHVGLTPTGHLLVSVWATGMIAVMVAAGTSSLPVWPALAMAAGASMTAGVCWVAWARHPRGLAVAGLPGTGPPQSYRPAVERFEEPLRWVSMAVQLAATGTLVVSADDDVVAIIFGAALAVYTIGAVLTVALAATRAFRGDNRLRGVLAEAVAGYRPQVLVHFSGSMRTVYQLDQWMPFVASSGLRVLLLLREEATFEAVTGRWDVPCVYIRDFPDLDLVVDSGVAVALYVNTGTKNNHLIRFGSITHVQIHHGDSDKPVSSGRTMRLYDHHFVAGPAGAARLRSAGAISGPESVSLVGRPQIHSVAPGASAAPRRTVLYAPTWEGFHVDTPLCSLAGFGVRLVREMPDDIELIVRPHPLTGSVDRSLQRVLAELRRALAERGEKGRFVDPASEDLSTTIAGADVLITDVSSVLVDFLAADRPAIVTDAPGMGADELHRRYPTTSWAGILDTDLANLGALLEDAFTKDSNRELRAGASLEFLGGVTSPEAAFHSSLRALVDAAGAQDDRVPVES